MKPSFREKLSRFLSREDILKRLARRGLKEALNSPLLRETNSTRDLQKAHVAMIQALKDPSRKGRLHGKVAIITGGASGIGRATAILFASEGARVVVADLKHGAVDEITAAGGEALYVQTDLLIEADVEALVQQTISAFGKIDVLVNNAGAIIKGDIIDLQPEQWQRSLDLNLTSAYRCCRHAIPHMIKAGGGSVIMTASIQGMRGMQDFAGYATAKGGLIALTRQVARQYARSQVRVNCVSPGVVLTPVFDETENVEEMTRLVSEYTPLGIVGVPEDIAYLNLFLASDESSYITGINIVADGGITMRGS
jgi:NAD(P)-dependent dehydrogenase (short-subunit alcohol dehydrogenase family)